MSQDRNDRTPQVVQDCHELLVWIVPQLDKLPRARRFTLGDRIETRLLQVLERLVEAAYSRDQQVPLQAASLKLEVVRHRWRVWYRLCAIPLRGDDPGSRQFEHLGRQIGGWARARRG